MNETQKERYEKIQRSLNPKTKVRNVFKIEEDGSKTTEGDYVETKVINSMGPLWAAIGDYASYIHDFIEDMEKVFPTLGKDWGIYMPEVKYLAPEPLVNYDNLSLTRFPNVHFVGDALSARGITVSGAQGTLVAEQLLIDEDHKEKIEKYPDFVENIEF